MVVQFQDTPSKGQYLIQAGWDDVTHLTEQTKETLLASFPVHQREMRTKGIPMLGHGRIYDLSEEFITCDPFEIPDHWMVINGMDFGWDHPQAQVQLAIDMGSLPDRQLRKFSGVNVKIPRRSLPDRQLRNDCNWCACS